MLGLYLLLIVLAILFTIGGYEATMRIFYYLDLQLRYAWIQFRMALMRRKLKAQLIKQTEDYEKLFKDLKK